MSDKRNWKVFLYRVKVFLYIVIGTGIFAVSVQGVYDPCGMVVGGFSGIAIMVKELTGGLFKGGIPLGLTTFVLNVPLFIVALPLKGRRFIIKTLLATVLLSVWLGVLPPMNLVGGDFVLGTLFGGLLCGVGIGMVLATGATTGGTDMLASVLQRFIPIYSIAQIMFMLDAIIIIAGALLFGLPSALYAATSVYVTSKISDAFVVGARYAKSVYIITSEPEAVAQAVFREVERGVTGLSGKGMYTGREKLVLFCVVAKKEIVRLKECIYRTDPDAFVIVTEAQEVNGEGFHHITQNQIG